MNFILIQLIGAIAYITIAISYYRKEKKSILFMQIIAYMFFTLHYFLLAGISGVVCNLVGLFALVVIYIFDKYKLKYKWIASMFFIAALIVVNLITFQNIYSIFPMVASVIVIISFVLDNEDFIRKIGIVSALCWLVYAIVYKSYISIAFEALTLVGVCVALIKHSKK